MQSENFPSLWCGTDMPIDISFLQSGLSYICPNAECGETPAIL